MLRFAPWKIASIIGMIVVAVLLVVPSLLSPALREGLDARLPAWAHPRTLTLGLDLQGGSHVLLQVDGTDVVKTMVGNLRDDARRILREEHVATIGGIGTQPRGISLRVPDAAERAKVLPRLRQLTNPTASILGSTGGRRLRPGGQRLGPDHHRGDGCWRHRQDPPRGRPVDRGDPPPRRRARHHRAADRARG